MDDPLGLHGLTRPGTETRLNVLLCAHDDLVRKMNVMYQVSEEQRCELRCSGSMTGLRSKRPPGLFPHILAHHRRISHITHTHKYTAIPLITHTDTGTSNLFVNTLTHTTFICNHLYFIFKLNKSILLFSYKFLTTRLFHHVLPHSYRTLDG